MTLKTARKILQSPKFGDPMSLQAKRRVELEDSLDGLTAEDLRKALDSRERFCVICLGRGCRYCDDEGTVTIRMAMIKDLNLAELRDLMRMVWDAE